MGQTGNNGKFISTGSAAKILRVTPRTVQNMIRDGRLEGRRNNEDVILSNWLVPEAEVVEIAKIRGVKA